MKYTYKINNPLTIEQKFQLDVFVNSDLEFDYSNVEWVGIDTEFLSLNILQDKLCVIQVASFVDGKPRIEILSVFEKEPGENLKKMMSNKSIGKIFHYAKADMPRIEKFISDKIQGEIFDTYVAAKLILTNIGDYSLDGITQYLVDPRFQKNKKMPESEWDLPVEMWEEEQIEYAANDVLYLEPIMYKISNIAKRRGKGDILKEIMQISPKLFELSNKGYDLSKIF